MDAGGGEMKYKIGDKVKVIEGVFFGQVLPVAKIADAPKCYGLYVEMGTTTKTNMLAWFTPSELQRYKP